MQYVYSLKGTENDKICNVKEVKDIIPAFLAVASRLKRGEMLPAEVKEANYNLKSFSSDNIQFDFIYDEGKKTLEIFSPHPACCFGELDASFITVIKDTLENLQSLVGKNSHATWKGLENNHLPGIVRKLNQCIGEKKIKELDLPTIMMLREELISIAKEEKNSRSNLAFWKNSKRHETTQKLIDIVKAFTPGEIHSMLVAFKTPTATNADQLQDSINPL